MSYINGSSRIGLWDRFSQLISRPPEMQAEPTAGKGTRHTHTLGPKNYELTTISDRKLTTAPGHFTAYITSSQDYYPGGSLMPGRKYNANAYRFGYQASEKDDEITGVTGSYITTHFRENDTRLLRWWSTDPNATAFESPYLSMGGNPIINNDVLGDSLRPQGSPEFLKQYENYYNAIMQTDQGKKLLTWLEGQDDITITETSVLKSNYDNARNHLQYGQEEGVAYNGVSSKSFTTLGHELVHAYNDMKGTLDKGYIKVDGQLFYAAKDEYNAVGFENYLRSVYGINEIRRNYSAPKITGFKYGQPVTTAGSFPVALFPYAGEKLFNPKLEKLNIQTIKFKASTYDGQYRQDNTRFSLPEFEINVITGKSYNKDE